MYECEHCKNTNDRLIHHYDGCLGYEAWICMVCGEWDDFTDGGTHHKADEWSKQFVKEVKLEEL